MLISHEPVVRLLFLSTANVTRNRLPDHRISPNSAEQKRFLYFNVRNGKTVSEMKNDSAQGSKPEGRKLRPEMEHFLPKSPNPENRLSASAESLTPRERR
jgi:hypothetical protein